MPENTVPQEILIITDSSRASDTGAEPRRGSMAASPLHVPRVVLSRLPREGDVFLQQLNVVMSETPEKVGDFKLAEFEVSAGITVQGKGEVKLALLASGEL